MKKLIAGICLLALCACGSATDSVTFTAPDGYTSKASLGPFMQIWAGKSPHDVLILLALPVAGDLHKSIDQSQVKGAKFNKTEQISICDNQAAIYAEGQGDMENGSSSGDSASTKQPSKIEIIATEVKGKTYLAMYGRPFNAPADPAAEKAIRNVCPK